MKNRTTSVRDIGYFFLPFSFSLCRHVSCRRILTLSFSSLFSLYSPQLLSASFLRVVMNACTETAPDIRVAGPAQDFLVRTFALFRVTGATGRRNVGRTEAAGMNTVQFFVRQARRERGPLYWGHRP